ncbi:MAG: SoxR reducing system RseC family protein [Chitinispirillia bacterium]|jgi:hypothetical protein
MSFLSFIGELIIEDSVILETMPKGIKVALNPNCEEDTSCHEQGCTKCSTSKKTTKLFVAVPESHNYSCGEKIRIKFFSPHKLLSVFLIFGLPILFIVLTMTGWHYFVPKQAESGLAVGSALIAGAVGFFLNAFFEKGFKMMYPPRVVTSDPSH